MTLQANLDIMENFHNKENLHSVALTLSLVQNIMKSMPMEVRPSFNDQFSKFRKQCPDNVRSPAMFLFLAQFIEELEKNYRSTPYLYDLDFSPLNVGVNVISKQCLDNVQPPAMFSFLAQFVDELEKNYRSTPYLYDRSQSI